MEKKYSLALGWWAARWFVHIWVLKYLEEKDVQIDEISWTSMWAIIAAMIAVWKTSEEMVKISKSLNFLKFIDFDLSYWLLKWEKVVKKLDEIFWDVKIEDLKIKLKIVATNLETGEQTVFTKWSIVKALRASLSLPGVFIPYKIDGKSYIDWWITNNLPVSVLAWENIIWVTALKQPNWYIETKMKILWMEFSKWFFDYSYRLWHRTLLFMMKQNEIRSIENAPKWSIILNPNFWDLDYYSFDKIDEFVELWYKLAKEQLD